MRPTLKSVGLTLLLVGSTTIALCIPTINQSPVLAQSTTTPDRKAEGVSEALREANRLLQQGGQQYQTSQYEAALQSWEAALKLYRELDNRNGEASALNNLGLAYRSLSQYDKAISYYQQALPLFQQVKDRNGEAKALMNLGIAYHSLSQYDKAISYYQQALPLFQQVKDRNGEANALTNLGIAYGSLSQADKAINYYQQALPLFQQVKDRNGEAWTLNSLGVAYDSLSQADKAIRYYQQALPLFQKVKNRNGEAWTLNSLGVAYLSLWQYDKAISYFQQALPILQQVKDRKGEASALNNLGIVYNFLWQYDKAISYFQQALPIFQQVKDRNSEAKALGNLGIAYDSLSQADKAISYYQQALLLFQQVKNRGGEAGALNGLGVAYRSLSQYDKAFSYYQQALSLFQQVKDRKGEAKVLENLGTAYRSLSQYEKAISYYQQALPLYQQVKDRDGEGTLLNNIGILLAKQKQPELAIVFYKQSVNIYELIRQDLRKLPHDSQESYTQAVTTTYRALADLLLAKGRILEAQAVLELLKVQELKDFDRTTRAKIDNGKIALDPTEQTIVDKYGGFIAFGQQLRECQASKPTCAEYDRFIQLRMAANAEYNRAVKTFEAAIKNREQQDKNNFLNPENRFSGKVQEILETQPNSALIYSLVTDDKLWLVLATKGEALRQFEVKVSQTELNSTVVKFRQLMEQCEQRSCDTSDTAALNAVSQTLYGWLFPKPLQQELQGKIKHLVFAQDRITRYIPMSALFDGKQYLIENYTVATIVSAEYTTTDRPNYDPKTATVLAAGLSNAAPPNFQALSNVPLELAAIVQSKATRSGIYPGLELLNKQFDRFNLQKNIPLYSILHIATHGAFVREQADGSYILLGTGKKLPIAEIKELSDLGKVQLVVLSACQTALADRGADGIEISNVSYSFLERGVKAVIASLWQVNDASTSVLMQQFYKNLATGKMTKAEALRQAQLSLLNGNMTAKDAPARSDIVVTETRAGKKPGDFSHPYYWAPFILIGNSL